VRHGISSGLGGSDASGDVKIGRCATEFGTITCELTITNKSGGTSDYYVEAALEDKSGTNVGSATPPPRTSRPGRRPRPS
jgi:hypothetical protein